MLVRNVPFHVVDSYPYYLVLLHPSNIIHVDKLHSLPMISKVDEERVCVLTLLLLSSFPEFWLLIRLSKCVCTTRKCNSFLDG